MENTGSKFESRIFHLHKIFYSADIDEEMREIYEIELSTSAISIITNKVNQAAQEWQNRPFDPVYLIVWMVDVVFKVREKARS